MAKVFISRLQFKVKVFHVDISFDSTGGLSTPADRIYLPLYTHRPLCSLRLRQSNREKQMNASTQTPIHLSILGIQFSPWFSSAFPNGWLNQLCGARFKSSGMLGFCQWLVTQPEENKVIGVEQFTSSSTFIKICLYQDNSQINRAEKHFCLVKEFSKPPTVIQNIHRHSSRGTASENIYNVAL